MEKAKEQDHQQIQAGTLTDFLQRVAREDEVTWSPSPSGQVSTKSTWKAFRYRDAKDPWAAIIWFPKMFPNGHS